MTLTPPATREIRVFLSSPFKDMEAERNYLLTHVFPEFRKLCLERLVTFTEIDLRWGVTEEQAKNGHTVEICLAGIDHCRDIKPPPFFIGFLGERYGWVPRPEELARYWSSHAASPYLPRIKAALETGISATELEIRVALLEPSPQEHKTRGKIFLRARELTDKLGTEANAPLDDPAYYDGGDGRLDRLKDVLRSTPYMALDNYDTIEIFGESVKTFLSDELDHWFPEKSMPSVAERITRAHALYALSRGLAYVPLGKFEDQVLALIQQSRTQPHSRPIRIFAESGYGKSAFLSHLATRFADADDTIVFSHFVGADGFPELTAWRDRLIAFLDTQGSSPPIDTPHGDERWKILPALLAETVRRTGKTLILMLDAINQFTDVDAETRARAAKPEISPKEMKAAVTAEVIFRLQGLQLPEGVVLIVSTIPDVKMPECQNIELPGFTEEQRHEAIRQFFEIYRKEFSSGSSTDLMPILTSAEACKSPLFLRLVMEELRLHARHETLTEKTRELIACKNAHALFYHILREMDLDFTESGHSGLATRAVRLMTASWRGLSPNDLGYLLASPYDPVDPATARHRLPDQTLTPLLARLSPFCLNDDGRMTLMHEILRQAPMRKGRRSKFSISHIKADAELDAERKELFEYFISRFDSHSVSESVYQTRWIVRNIVALADPYGDNDLYVFEEPWETEKSVSDERVPFLQKLLERLRITRPADDSDRIWVTISLADIHKDRKSYIESAALYREALRVLRQRPIINKRELIEVLDNLATIFLIQKTYHEAEMLYHEALDVRRRILPVKSQDILIALNRLAERYKRYQCPAKAAHVYRDALCIRKKVYPTDRKSIATTLTNIADLFTEQGRYPAAERLYRRISDILRELLPSGNRDYIKNLIKLADVCGANGKYLEAVCFYNEALKMTSTEEYWVDKDIISSIVDKTLKNISFYGDGGHREAARNLYCEFPKQLYDCLIQYPPSSRTLFKHKLQSLLSRSLKMLREVFPCDDPHIENALENFGKLSTETRNYPDAVKAYQDILDIRRRTMPADHPRIAQGLENIANVYVSQELYDRAEPFLHEALEIWRKTLPANDPGLVACLKKSADFYRSWTGHREKAEPFYRETLSILRETLPGSRSGVVQTLDRLAEIYQEKGSEMDAEPFYVEALEISRIALPQSDLRLADALEKLARLYFENNQGEKAEPLYTEALEILSDKVYSDDPSVLGDPQYLYALSQTLHNLASLYQESGRYDDAEALYREAVELNRNCSMFDYPNIVDALEHLARFYMQQGRVTEAEPLYREAERVNEQGLLEDRHQSNAEL